MTKRTKNASQREWPTCSLQCAAQIRPVEVALYWLKLITDQLKVNFFGGVSSGNPVEVCRLLIEKVRFPVFKRSATWKRTAVSFDLWCYILRVGVFALHDLINKLWASRGGPFHFWLRRGVIEWFVLGIFFQTLLCARNFFLVRACACMTFFPPLFNSLLKKVEAKQFLSKRAFYNLCMDIYL